MARWLAQLEGELIDLQEFPYWFPDGDVFAVREGDRVYITGEALERFSAEGEVNAAANQALDEFGSVIALLWPSLRRPSIAQLFREDDGGHRKAFVFLSGSITARSRMRATLTVQGAPQEARRPTQAQELLDASRRDTHLGIAVALWGDGVRTWPRLYRILEEVERYLGQRVDKAGLCTTGERDRFTHSANSADIAREDSRHASGKFQPPKNPMDINEAAGLIGNMLMGGLRRAGPLSGSGGAD